MINNVIDTNDNALEWFQINCWTLMTNVNHVCEIRSKQYESMEGQKKFNFNTIESVLIDIMQWLDLILNEQPSCI